MQNSKIMQMNFSTFPYVGTEGVTNEANIRVGGKTIHLCLNICHKQKPAV
jgi:hypothetical protein